MARRIVVMGMVPEIISLVSTRRRALPLRHDGERPATWRIVSALLAGLLVFTAAPAWARISVGAAPTCDVHSIQAALDLLLSGQQAGESQDPFIVIAGGDFNEALHIDGGGATDAFGTRVTLVGGYAADCSGPVAQGLTTIDAAGYFSSAITVKARIAVTLSNLSITGGDTQGEGGGIAFDGAGSLALIDVDVFDNHAGRGGGLYANGKEGGLLVSLYETTAIFGNSADHAGGGIRVQGNTHLVATGGAVVSSNSVDENDPESAGGGIQILGPAKADIGSGLIVGNSAKNGGGIWTGGSSGENAFLRFFTTKAGHRTRIDSNRATQFGGGLFVSSSSALLGASQAGLVCGFGYSISGNSATDGAAIYADNTSPTGNVYGSIVDLRASVLHNTDICGSAPASTYGALGCVAGTTCNAINGNRSVDLDDEATHGAIVVLKTNSFLDAEQVELRANVGENLWRGFGSVAPRTCSNCLLADNRVGGSLVRMDDGGSLAIAASTIAGNRIGGSSVLSLAGDLALTNSLLWQPDNTTLDQAAGRARTVSNVLASEIASLSGGTGVAQTYPLFRDPIHGDYRLSPYSPALDYAAATDGQDLVGLPRSVDLSIPDRPGGGPLDLGAYELQADDVFPPDEHFDAVGAPELPPEWINVQNGTGPGWVTTTTTPASVPNAAFVADPSSVSDNSLLAPALLITNKGRLRFRYKMDLEAAGNLFARDGVVLEIAIGNGSFADIQIAGGTFVSGGYDHVIPFSGPAESPPNPLLGRSVWSGTTGENYKDVVVDLPAFADGKIVRLKWRIGTNISNEAPHAGYWLDDVHLDVDGIGELFCGNFEEGVACQ